MKKTLLVVFAVGAIFSSLAAQDLELGAEAGMALNPRWSNSFALGVKGSYPVTGPIFAVMSFHYFFSPIAVPTWFDNFKSSAWNLNVMGQYRFNLARSKLIPYAILGMGLFNIYQSYSSVYFSDSFSKTKWNFIVGAGLILPILARMALDFSIRYTVINGLVGDVVLLTIGIIYFSRLLRR